MKHKELRFIFFPHYVPWERCFQLVKKVLKELSPGYLFEAEPCLATGEWGRISDFIISLSCSSYMSGAFILVSQHKDINSSQSLEILKVKATSAYIFINLTRRPFFLCALTTAQTIEHK